MLNLLQQILAGNNPLAVLAANNASSSSAPSGGAGAAASGNTLGAVAQPMQQSFSDEDRRQVFTDQLGKIGAMLLAGGQRQTSGQRAATLGQMANVMGDTPRQLLNMNQARLMGLQSAEAQKDLDRRTALEGKLQDPAFLKSLGISPEQAAMLGPAGLTKILESQMSQNPVDQAYKMAMIKKLQEGDARQWQVVGEDEFGNKRYGYPPLPGEAPTGAPMGLPGGQPAGSIMDRIGDKRGMDALAEIKKFDPAIGATVEGMAMGDIPFSPSLLKSKRGEMIESLVRLVDPSYSPTTYDSRKSAVLDQTKGKSSVDRKNADTALRHFAALYENSDLLPQNEWSVLSGSANALDLAKLRKTGNVQAPEMQKLSRYDNTLEVGGDEMAKALGIGSEGGREAIKHMFDPSQGRGVVREKIRNQIRLLKEKMDVQKENWDNVMGPAAGKLQIISPNMETAFKLGNQKPMTEGVLTKAKDAISKGADKNAVIKHLIDSGYDPAGL